jgi:hypothetical protein
MIKWQSSLDEGLKNYSKKTMKSHSMAGKKVGLQLLNYIVNGSPKEGVTPPILTGTLRGSASVFFENEIIQQGPNGPSSISGNNKNKITVVFNVPYAARMHEGRWNPGPVSQQAGNVGNKFISKHVDGDKIDLMKMYAKLIKKENG